MGRIRQVNKTVTLNRSILRADRFRGNARNTTNSSTNAFQDQLRMRLKNTVNKLNQVLRNNTIRVSLSRITTDNFRYFLSNNQRFAHLTAARAGTALTVARRNRYNRDRSATAFCNFNSTIGLGRLLSMTFITLLLIIYRGLRLRSTFADNVDRHFRATIMLRTEAVRHRLNSTNHFNTLNSRLAGFLNYVSITNNAFTRIFIRNQNTNRSLTTINHGSLNMGILKETMRTRTCNFRLTRLRTYLTDTARANFFLSTRLLYPASS